MVKLKKHKRDASETTYWGAEVRHPSQAHPTPDLPLTVRAEGV